jgi:hypothetical protein
MSLPPISSQRLDVVERMLAVHLLRGVAIETFFPPGIVSDRRSDLLSVRGVDNDRAT